MTNKEIIQRAQDIVDSLAGKKLSRREVVDDKELEAISLALCTARAMMNQLEIGEEENNFWPAFKLGHPGRKLYKICRPFINREKQWDVQVQEETVLDWGDVTGVETDKGTVSWSGFGVVTFLDKEQAAGVAEEYKKKIAQILEAGQFYMVARPSRYFGKPGWMCEHGLFSAGDDAGFEELKVHGPYQTREMKNPDSIPTKNVLRFPWQMATHALFVTEEEAEKALAEKLKKGEKK